MFAAPLFMLFHSTALAGLRLLLFVKRPLFCFVGKVESAQISTKLAGVTAAKGAVGVSVVFDGTTLLFVDAHLTAHQANVKDRNDDFRTVCRGLGLPQKAHIQRQLSFAPTPDRLVRNKQACVLFLTSSIARRGILYILICCFLQ
jgi:hypothetical protein